MANTVAPDDRLPRWDGGKYYSIGSLCNCSIAFTTLPPPADGAMQTGGENVVVKGRVGQRRDPIEDGAEKLNRNDSRRYRASHETIMGMFSKRG